MNRLATLAATFCFAALSACSAASGTTDDGAVVHQGLVVGDDGNIETIDYVVGDDGLAIRNGDIAVGPATALPEPAAIGNYSAEGFGLIRKSGALWPRGHVPYVFGPGADEAAARDAMKSWEDRTGFVKFTPRTTEKNFLRFVGSGGGCVGWSYIGITSGRQDVHLTRGCGSSAAGVLRHELGHALGLEHEMQRPDRDDFVVIHWDNVQSGFRPAFAKETKTYRTYGAYDYASVMQYSSYEFSKDGKATITKKDGALIPWTGTLSQEDIRSVTNMYSLQRCGFGERMFAAGDCIIDESGQGTQCRDDGSWSPATTCSKPSWDFRSGS